MRDVILYFIIILFSFTIGDPYADEDSPMYLLELSSVGFPAAEKQEDAWNVLDLKIFNNRLYLGYGDATVNTGPTDVIYYDLEKEGFFTEFTVDDEAIYSYQIVDGKLIIPGIDATEDWDFGNIYVLADSGWVKYRTITNALHVFDVVSFKNHWYASTGSVFEFGDQDYYAFGGIFRSEDEGATWQLVYSTPTDETTVYRVRSLVPFQGELYASVYAYTGMSEAEIPEQYRSALGETYQGQYLIYTGDALGILDVIAFDDSRWKYSDIIPESHLCTVSSFVYQDKLVLSTLSGEYIDYSGIKDGLPEHGRTALYTFDGHQTEKISFEYELIKDKIVQNDRLFLLVLNDRRYHIAETTDLTTWKRYFLPQSIERPLSIEYDGDSFYIGDEKGNIFKSTDMIEIADLDQTRDYQPKKIFGAAKLPRDGKWYWSAITDWQIWGKLARISCEITGADRLEVTTDNISQFAILVPKEIDPMHRLITVTIDDTEYIANVAEGGGALLCLKAGDDEWIIKNGPTAVIDSFEYTRRIVGRAEIDLTRASEDSSIALWYADILRWETSADIALCLNDGAKKDLPAGEIALEDIFDMNYRNSICLFKVTGETLKRMINFNVKLAYNDRCQAAGFEFTYEAYGDQNGNRVIEFSLDLEKEYTVAIANHYAERAERFFGEEIEFEDSGISIVETIIRWLQKYGSVGKMEKTVTMVKK